MMRSVFDRVYDAEFGPSDPEACKSCGIPFVKHLGLTGTCRELIEARERCEQLANHIAERDTLILKLADMVIVKDMKIRELKRDMEEGQ